MDALLLQRSLLAQTSRLRRHIYSKLPPNLRNVVAVDDILQETCAVAFRQSRHFDLHNLESFDAWITMIANQCVADMIRTYRRVKRGGRVGRESAIFGQTSYVNLFNRLAIPSPTPSSEAAVEEAVAFLRVAVSELPEEQRLAVEMHHLDGRSYEDISRTMDKSVPAVRGLLQRAMRTLRTDLGRASRFFSDASLSREEATALEADR